MKKDVVYCDFNKDDEINFYSGSACCYGKVKNGSSSPAVEINVFHNGVTACNKTVLVQKTMLIKVKK